MATVLVTPEPENSAVISFFAPVNATLPHRVGGGAHIAVITDYPFGDTVRIVVVGVSRGGMQLKVRVPGWATRATVTTDSGVPVPAVSGAYHTVECGAGDTEVLLNLSPQISVETGWGGYKGTDLDVAVVYRGPLMFALGLDEEQHLLHKPWACFEHGCSTDVSITSTRDWSYALVVPGGRSTVAPSNMWLERSGSIGPISYSGGSNATVRVIAAARLVRTWGMSQDYPDSAAPPTRLTGVRGLR